MRSLNVAASFNSQLRTAEVSEPKMMEMAQSSLLIN